MWILLISGGAVYFSVNSIVNYFQEDFPLSSFLVLLFATIYLTYKFYTKFFSKEARTKRMELENKHKKNKKEMKEINKRYNETTKNQLDKINKIIEENNKKLEESKDLDKS